MEYALMAIQYIYDKQVSADPALSCPVSVKEISQNLGCPFDSMSRVLQKVSGSGDWLKSTQGTNGGYVLDENKFNTVSLYELLSALSGPLKIVKCIDGDCSMLTSCNIQTPIHKFNSKLENFYKNIKVNSLLNGPSVLRASNVIHSQDWQAQ